MLNLITYIIIQVEVYNEHDTCPSMSIQDEKNCCVGGYLRTLSVTVSPREKNSVHAVVFKCVRLSVSVLDLYNLTSRLKSYADSEFWVKKHFKLFELLKIVYCINRNK